MLGPAARMDAHRRFLRRDWALAVLVAAGTVAVYARAVTFDFVNFDDPLYVTRNALVQGGVTWRAVAHVF
ncbi:MAG: hypothetical protein GWN37_10670, partial [Gammaproteobacteria bacterium]|nr:hypothetical protein [Gammaproteobacteria bacterium]